MRNVWMLNHYAQEPGGPGGARHFLLAKHLRQLGWQTTILAASVEHATLRQRLAFHELSRIEYFDHIPFVWFWTPRYNGNGLRRLLNMLTYSIQAVISRQLSALPGPDVVIGSTVHPFAAVSAEYLSRRYRVPFVFEIRDLWPQTLIDLGKLDENSLQTRFFHAIEDYLLQRADRIVTLLPNAGAYLSKKGVANRKISWIPNGFEDGARTRYAPAQEKSDFTLMYFGSHGQTNQLSTLLDALACVKRRNHHTGLKVRIIGDGPLKRDLMRRARTADLDFVYFEMPVPRCDIPHLASEADGFVVCLADLPIYHYGISLNKIFDYMAAGKPVIISGNPFNNPIRDADAGLTVPPEDPMALADAITALMAMSVERRTLMGANAVSHVRKNHTYRQLASQLANLLNDAIGDQPKIRSLCPQTYPQRTI